MDAEPPNHKDDISAIPAPVSLVPGVLSHAFDPNDTPPPNIEGYEVLNYLGEGASGIVWRATQLSTGRQVALKLMGGAVFGTEKAKARFEREVELAARLNHPNIARLYESGIRHGYYYYAMELIEGLPLDEYAKQHHLSQDKIVVLMQKVCNAIQHAHACGVIHRDLKPSNILVSADGEPHVLDFGLAKAAAQRRSNITVTIDGQAAGTVAYMSPEQAAGKLDEIGIGSDIYSLGVILFELLTGDYPHEQSDSIYEQLVRVVRDEPRPPRSLNPAIDKDLEAIILKAISPHPQDRYAIAVEFARDLENYLAGDAVQARPLTLPYFIGKRIRKHRGRVALISAILIVFAATLAIAYVRVAHERDYANQQADAANQALYFNHIALATSELEKHHIGRTRELLQQCPAALRNWEWRYLFAASDQSIKTFNTGEGRIRTMAVNGQGNLVYGKNQKQICIMRLSDGDILISRDIDYDHLAISVDGGFCVVATGTQLRILDIDSLRDRRPAIELSQPIAEITVSPDGWIAAGYATGGFIVLDSNGVVLHEWAQSPLRGQLRWMTGHRLAGFAGQAIEVVDASNGDMQVQRLYKDRWGAIAEHLNEHGIGAASIGGVVRRLDSGGNSLWTTNLGQSSVLSIASDSSGTWLATGDAQGSICLWTDAMIEPSRILAGHDASVTGICFGINSSQLISADHKGVIKVWQLGEEHSQTRTIQMPGLVSAFAASTAGNVYAVGLDSGEVLVRDTAVPSQWTLFPGNTSVCMLAFDATGTLALYRRCGGTVLRLEQANPHLYLSL